jgi:CRISPR-associated endoribonuclease Cas6
MRLKISLVSQDKVVLAIGYNHAIQAVIYKMLDRASAEWLHKQGFKYEKRSFRHFTFSSILERGEYRKKQGIFIFPESISFLVSSPIEWLLEQVVQNTISSDIVELGRNQLKVKSVEVLPEHEIEGKKIRINTLTPVEVHSTFENHFGSKKTYYYAPTEREFSDLVNANLQKKWSAFYDKECQYDLKIYPVRTEYLKKSIQKFKGIVIQGWKGHFWLEGEPEFLLFALECGIGSKSSAGYGMIEVVKPNNVVGSNNIESNNVVKPNDEKNIKGGQRVEND